MVLRGVFNVLGVVHKGWQRLRRQLTSAYAILRPKTALAPSCYDPMIGIGLFLSSRVPRRAQVQLRLQLLQELRQKVLCLFPKRGAQGIRAEVKQKPSPAS